MIDYEEEAEDFDVADLLQQASDKQPEPEFTLYESDAEFRQKHPLALRALCGGVDVQRGLRPYALVAVENPLRRPWVFDYSTGLPNDAFRPDNPAAPCKYRPEHLRIRFTWEPGETKLVPILILQGLWQIKNNEVVGGGGSELRLAKGQMPPLSPGLQRVKEEEEARTRSKSKVRS